MNKKKADPPPVLETIKRRRYYPGFFISAGIISAFILTCRYKRDKRRVTREIYVNGKIYRLAKISV